MDDYICPFERVRYVRVAMECKPIQDRRRIFNSVLARWLFEDIERKGVDALLNWAAMEPLDEYPQYEVSAILGIYVNTTGAVRIRVQWRGYPVEESSIEPISHIEVREVFENLLEQYCRNVAGANGASDTPILIE